jgi:hypothetical protein
MSQKRNITSIATEKQSTGFTMTSRAVTTKADDWTAIAYQDGRRVFMAQGCESKQHADQVARDICVRYALIERPEV